MKKLLALFIIITLTFYSCEDNNVYNTPSILDSEKTVQIFLDNIPESQLGEDIYFFVLKNNIIYSTEQSVAKEDTIVSINPPNGAAAFDIVAFIPASSKWKIGDNFSQGYYSALKQTIERESYYTTLSWQFSEGLNYLGLINNTLVAELVLSDTICDQGDIIYLSANISSSYPSPINTVKYFLSGSEIVSYSEEPFDFALNTLNISPGEHIIKVVATNDEGHISTDEEEIYIEAIENEAPVVEITSHINGAEIIHSNDELITTDINDPEGELDRVEFKINNTIVETLTEAPYEYLWETLDNNLGTNTITVTAFDSEGASRSDVINVVLVEPDNYPPVVNITSPGDGNTFSAGALIDIRASATDVDNEVVLVNFYIDNSVLQSFTTSPFEILDFDTSVLSAGAHEIKVTAWDEASLEKTKIITINIE